MKYFALGIMLFIMTIAACTPSQKTGTAADSEQQIAAPDTTDVMEAIEIPDVPEDDDPVGTPENLPVEDEIEPTDLTPPEDISSVVSFDLIAKQWEFVPDTITVNEGDTVTLIVQNVDVDHGILIPAFGVDEILPADQTIELTFVADKVGTFPLFCNVFCGQGHSHMGGQIIVN